MAGVETSACPSWHVSPGAQKTGPLHIKRHHMVSRGRAGRSRGPFWPRGAPRRPPRENHAVLGAQRAGRFQRGVVLKLLVRVPLRQRNVREMQLDGISGRIRRRELHFEFAGDDLKIGHRGSQINKYELNLSEYDAQFSPGHSFPHLGNGLPCTAQAAGRHDLPFRLPDPARQPHIQKTLHLDLSEPWRCARGSALSPISENSWATEFLKEPRFPNGGHDVGRSAQDGDRRLLPCGPSGAYPQGEQLSGQAAAHGLSGAVGGTGDTLRSLRFRACRDPA